MKDRTLELQSKDILAAGSEKIVEEQISSRKPTGWSCAHEYVREGDNTLLV